MIWKNIRGYFGLYQVSSCGKIRVLPRKRRSRHGVILYKGRVLAPAISEKGYRHVNLCRDGNQRSFYVHVLVATYFVKGKAPGLEVNHIDGDKSNNNHWNLEWGTHKHNQEHAGRAGLMKSGSNHKNSKLTEKLANEIKVKFLGKKNYVEVAKKYKINRNIAYRIMKGMSYTQSNNK